MTKRSVGNEVDVTPFPHLTYTSMGLARTLSSGGREIVEKEEIGQSIVIDELKIWYKVKEGDINSHIILPLERIKTRIPFLTLRITYKHGLYKSCI